VKSELVRALAADATRQLAVGDQSSTRTVYAVILALVTIGVVLLFIGAWILRQTKPDPELLAPLERMADRSWRQQDPAQKRRTLDEARPEGAQPVLREKGVPEVDQDFAQSKPSIGHFDDLRSEPDAERRRAAQGDPLTPEKLVADADADHDTADHDTADHDTADHDTADDTGEIASNREWSAPQDDK
jgi:hypothetical protein